MLDTTERERRRFARLLGLDGDAGCGLPVGDTADTQDHRSQNHFTSDDA